MKTISVKLFLFSNSGSGDSICRYFLFRPLPTPISAEQNHLCNFSRGHHENISVKLVEIWSIGSEDVI